MSAMSDWEVVCHFVHYSGEGKLSEREYKTAWQLADGFGKGCYESAARSGFYGDWSHFRDSSPEAKKEVASYLRRVAEIGDAAEGRL